MIELLLLRHARSTWNQEERFQGWADPPLSSAGRDQARSWGSGLTTSFEYVVCSDLQRATATAQAITDASGIPFGGALRGLREQDQGRWTGLTKAQVKRYWPDRYRERPRRPVSGEDAADVLSRAIAALDDLAVRYPSGRLLVVTHAGVIRAFERRLGAPDRSVGHMRGRWLAAGADPGPAGMWQLGPAFPAADGEVPRVGGTATSGPDAGQVP